jgi:non-ribosomal peptide synthetase component F
LPGIAFTPLKVSSEQTHFDLSLTVSERGDTLGLVFKYAAELFAADTVAQLGALFGQLLERVVRRQALPLREAVSVAGVSDCTPAEDVTDFVF